MNQDTPPKSRLKHVRLLVWSLVAVVFIGLAVSLIIVKTWTERQLASAAPAKPHFGGPFTLIASDGKPFASEALAGKPYAIYFGFTRCGHVCPTTLSRLVKLRRKAGGDESMRILFVTIDPAHDGPKDVGQYASLFNAPIIGLTGDQAQIDRVKKQFGIYAEPVTDAPMGKEMEHTAIVLLFDRNGRFAGTISPDESDSDALGKLRGLLA